MLSEMLSGSQTLEKPVKIWFDGFPKQVEGLNNLNNNDRQKFVQEVMKQLVFVSCYDGEKKERAESELVKVFGESCLESMAIQGLRPNGRFLFSLTGDGSQFRVWHGPFGHVSWDHFDSCGTGLVWSATCESSQVLRAWIAPLIERRVAWTSHFGTIWVGTN